MATDRFSPALDFVEGFKHDAARELRNAPLGPKAAKLTPGSEAQATVEFTPKRLRQLALQALDRSDNAAKALRNMPSQGRPTAEAVSDFAVATALHDASESLRLASTMLASVQLSLSAEQSLNPTVHHAFMTNLRAVENGLGAREDQSGAMFVATLADNINWVVRGASASVEAPAYRSIVDPLLNKAQMQMDQRIHGFEAVELRALAQVKNLGVAGMQFVTDHAQGRADARDLRVVADRVEAIWTQAAEKEHAAALGDSGIVGLDIADVTKMDPADRVEYFEGIAMDAASDLQALDHGRVFSAAPLGHGIGREL